MGITRLYKKRYTVKQWNRFNINMQQKLTNTYDVILTDHKTRSEKIKGIFTIKNLNKSIDAVSNGTEKFSKALEKFDMKDFKVFQGVSEKDYSSLMSGSKKDYSALIGSKSKKRDYSKLIGSRKKISL